MRTIFSEVIAQNVIGDLITVQVNAPTSEAPVNEIHSFCSLLQTIIDEQDNNAFLVIMGDFNAKVETDWMNAGRAIGRFGNGTLNEAGEQLIKFTNANDLLLTNTCFKQAKANRVCTFESPDGRTHSTIAHILIKKWRGSATNCRAYPSADLGSDYQLLILNIRLKLKAGRKSKPVQKFDIEKLIDKRVTEQYRQACSNQFEPLLAALNKD